MSDCLLSTLYLFSNYIGQTLHFYYNYFDEAVIDRLIAASKLTAGDFLFLFYMKHQLLEANGQLLQEETIKPKT